MPLAQYLELARAAKNYEAISMKQLQGPVCFSEPAAENLALRQALNGKDDLLAAIPSTPAVRNLCLMKSTAS